MSEQRKAMKDRAYVDNYPPLRDWLRAQGARCNWQVPLGEGPDPRAYIESWQAPTWHRDAVIVVRADRLGWNLYTSEPGNGTEAAFADAVKRLIPYG